MHETVAERQKLTLSMKRVISELQHRLNDLTARVGRQELVALREEVYPWHDGALAGPA